MSDAAAVPSTPPNTDVLAFLIADIRGYTAFTVEHGDEAGARLARGFALLAREVVDAHGGSVIELRGDEALAVFRSPRSALRAACNLQQQCLQASLDDPSLPFRVGVGLDAGEAVPVEDGYRGAALNLAARLCSLAAPGEVLASDTITTLARRLNDLEYLERGHVQLKGFADPVRVMDVRARPSDAVSIPPATHDEVADINAAAQRLPIGGFLGALPAGQLVGRIAEYGHIDAALSLVESGIGQLVVLAGEPGAGKTRLAQEATLDARNRGYLIAAGRCYEGEQTVPFYAFREAIGALHSASPAQLRAAVHGRWPDVEMLLPGTRAPGQISGGQEEQQRLFWAVASFLQAIAEEVPVALLLDDIHWADESTLKLVQYLARHTRTDRILILATYRDVEVSHRHPLEAALRDLSHEGLVHRIDVRRMDEAGTAALIGATMGDAAVSPEFASLIYGRTEGNPFFVQQVIRVLIERGDVFREDGIWTRKSLETIEVPESIRSVVGQRLQRLTDGTQEILREASVLGQTFRFDDLCAMTDRSEDDAEAGLDEAVRAGMVREMEGDAYLFDHALTQQSLYSELSARRRRRLHLAAGNAIASLPRKKQQGRDTELAWHFLQADDTEKALPYAVAAGDEAEAVYAHSEAELQYRTALELATELGHEQVEAEVATKLGRVLVILGRTVEALTVLERARAIHRAQGEREAEALVLVEVGRAHHAGGSSTEGAKQLPEAIEALGAEVSDGVMAELYTVLARLRYKSGQFNDLVSPATRALQYAESAGNDHILAEALELRGMAAMHHELDAEAAHVQYQRAIDIAERAGDVRVLGTALHDLAVSYAVRGNVRESLALNYRALQIDRRLGSPTTTIFDHAAVAFDHYLLGELEEARRHATEAFRIAGTVDASAATVFAGFTYYAVAALGEDREEAVRGLERVEALATESSDLQTMELLQPLLATLDLLQGCVDEALARLIPLEAELEKVSQAGGLPWLGLALLETGREEEAADYLKTCRELASSWYRVMLPMTLAFSANLATRRGAWDQAERDLENGLTLVHQTEVVEHEFWVLEQYGRFHAARGNRALAEARFVEALALCERVGLHPFKQRIRREMANALSAIGSETV